MERRRPNRPRPDSRQSIERAVRSWERLDQAWKTIFSGAQAIQNLERMALAEAKVEECESELARLRGLLTAREFIPGRAG